MSGQLPITLLYVEDEAPIRDAVSVFLGLTCARVLTAGDGVEGMEIFKQCSPDLVVTDILMPRLDGLGFAARLRKASPQLPIIITTAFSETEHLLRAIELGIQAFIRKPLDYDDLVQAITRAALPIVQQRELDQLRSQRAHQYFPGVSLPMAQLSAQIAEVAEGELSVLIHGEKGTGKARAARAIHALSRRSKLPFLTVSCRHVAPERLEIELFGKERGGIGSISAARGGTLLLRDIADAPLHTQAKLLRVMEEGVFYQAGGKEAHPCVVRVLATVTGDPRQAVSEGRLLEGLYFTLSDLALRVPPLREMPEEIPDLARIFLAEGAEDAGRSVPQLSEEALRFLARREWSGNLRELKNLMRRSVLHSGREIGVATLLPLLTAGTTQPYLAAGEAPQSLRLKDLERWAVIQALATTGGRKLKAAALLGIDYKRFQRKLLLYGVE